MELVLPMCYVHPYFSLKNLGKRARTIHGKTRMCGLKCIAAIYWSEKKLFRG